MSFAGATLQGSYSGATGTIYETGFYYGTSSGNLNLQITGDGSNSASGDFQCNITGLNASTKYYYKAYVLEWNASTSSYVERFGEEQNFTTSAAPAYVPTGWLELPRSTSGASLMTGTYRDGTSARNYTYLYDRSMYSSMWVAYPLYADTYSGSNKYSGSWGPATGNGFGTNNSNGYQINIWSNSYNVYLGNTMYSDPFSTSGNEYYARGHQIPDADRQYNQTMVQQTYYAINSTPQIQNKFNGGIWQQLEQAVRAQASTTDTLYVATGPAFDRADIAGTEAVTWITPRGDPSKTCPVPNYYWKVLLKVTRNGSGQVTSACSIGFWFVHQEYSNSNYASFAVSVNTIEERTGLDLFANLPDEIEETVEANSTWQTFQNF